MAAHSQRAERRAVAALVVAAGALRLAFALRSEIWLDEANSVLLASAPLLGLADAFAPDSSPPLYYLLLKAWGALFGLEAWRLKAASVLLGAAAVWGIWRVGHATGGPRTGLIAAALLAVHPLHVFYSEEVRMYALLFCEGLAFYHLANRAMPPRTTDGASAPEPMPWWPAAVVGAATALTHYYGLVYVGVTLACLAAARPAHLGRAIRCGAAVALGFAPWLPVFAAQLDNPHHVAWIEPFWAAYPEAAGILRSLQAFLPGGMKYPYLPLAGLPGQPAIVALGAAPLILWWARTRRLHLPAVSALPLAIVGGTLATLVLASYAIRPIYLAGRSDIVVLPLALLAFAGLIARLPGRFTRAVFTAIMIALSVVELGASAEALRKPGNDGVRAAVSESGCVDLVAAGLAYAPAWYQARVEGRPARVHAWPAGLARHAGNFDPRQYAPAELVADAKALAATVGAGPGVCLLVPRAAWGRPLVEAFVGPAGRYRAIGGLRLSVLGAHYGLLHQLDPGS